MKFLIIISIILLLIGLGVLWSECEPGEGGPCYIKWAILWFWKKKLLTVFLIVLIGGGITYYTLYFQSKPQDIYVRKARGGNVHEFSISKTTSTGKVVNRKLPYAFINSDGELEIVMGMGKAAQSEVLGPVVIYYTDNSVPIRARVILKDLNKLPELQYDEQLGMITIIFRKDGEIYSARSNGKSVAYFDKNRRIIKLEIPNVNIQAH